METNAPKRVLIIDGGGLRGLASLMIIDEVMKAVMARARKKLRPCEVFDLICGTSVGGFIAILLGRFGLDCATAIEYYKDAMSALLKNEGDKIWDNIAKSRFLETDEFKKYLDKVVGKVAGSPDVSMKLAIEDGQDLRKHPTTKTFVTAMEGAPDYPSSTHLIRSYISNKESQAVKRHWNIHEVVLATLASPIYLSPLSVTSDKKREFLDAGFCGYNNPISLTMKEIKNNWPQGRIETVLSLGTGLRDFLSNAPETIHVRETCKRLYQEKLQPQDSKNEDIDLNVTYAVRELTRIAADSANAHRKFEAMRSTHCDNYYRVDDAFSLGLFDLVDADRAEMLSGAIKTWLTGPGSKIVLEIASKLVAEGKTFEDKEAATYIKPPPPPPETIKGYNPLLDEPRPTKMEDYLRDFEVLFIVDDSASMEGERWSETRDALKDIAEFAFEMQAHTVSMRFMNNPMAVRGLQGRAKVMSIFDSVEPTNGTPTGDALEKVFNEHLTRINTAIPKGEAEYSKIPPLDIIVLTDGVPSDTPAAVIAKAVQKLNSSHYHPNTMGVQFVQIGNEDIAKQALKELVMGDNGRIVDTVPYHGKVTSQMLKRILLGGMHPNVRAMLPVKLLAI